jgi:Tfp pilus assembly protein PilO
MTPEEPEEMKSLSRHPVHLLIDGRFDELFTFVEALEQMPFTIWIDRLQLQSLSEASEKLTCELSLSIFTDNQDISD